jgi:hypothetical protein
LLRAQRAIEGQDVPFFLPDGPASGSHSTALRRGRQRHDRSRSIQPSCSRISRPTCACDAQRTPRQERHARTRLHHGCGDGTAHASLRRRIARDRGAARDSLPHPPRRGDV